MSYNTDEVVAALHEADGYLSLVGYRKADAVGRDLAQELIAASGRCRDLVKRVEEAHRASETVYTPPSAYVDRCVNCGRPSTAHAWPKGTCPKDAR